MNMIFTSRCFLIEVFAKEGNQSGLPADHGQMLPPFIKHTLPRLRFLYFPFLVYLRVLLHMDKGMEGMHR